MAPRKKGLGMGMEALMGTSKAGSTRKLTQTKEEEVSKDTLELDINQISPNKDQPRKVFDEDSLEELSESIKVHGMIEPIIVTKRKENQKEYYQIIAGERRWRAAKNAGLETVPVVVKEYTDREILEIALIENIQREDLNAIEEAQAYERLLKDLKLTQDQLAERVAKSRTAITNTMRLLKLSKKVQQMVVEERISAGHARALLAIEDKNVQYEFAQKIADEELSVRATESLIKKYLEEQNQQEEIPSKEDDSAKRAVEEIYKEKENDIQQYLKTKVSINDKGNKGKIVISYSNLEEFERIYDTIVSNS